MARGKNSRNLISAKETMEGIKINKDIKFIQNTNNTKYKEKIENISILDILKGVGIGKENTVIFLIISILKLSLISLKNTGGFLVGEQNTGKSILYSFFLKEKCKKISGTITLANLRGDARKSENVEKCLLEENTVIFEEMLNDPKINGEIIGLLKDCMESGSFSKKNEALTQTDTSFIFIGNNYSQFNNFMEITSQKILEDLPKEFKDRAFFDRIPIILPHYTSLFGKVKYVDEEEYILPIIDIEEIIDKCRELDIVFLLKDFSEEFEGREINIFNKFLFSLSYLFFQEENTNPPTWFLKGWIEFLKYFRKLLIGEYHNPFNKNSVKLILYLTGYKFDEVEYVAFDREDRLIIKLVDQKLFHKIALTGFGCRNNRLEIDYFYNNPNSNILSIKDIQKNDILLIQESGEYLPDKRIYLDNLREQHNLHHETDEEFNKLILTKMAKGEEGYSFRGIPKYFEKGLLLQTQEIFSKNITTINLKDFCFEKSEIKLLNFATYLKNN